MSHSQHTATGYGPMPGGRYQNLHFNGDERKYEMWEARFLGYMLMKGLKDTINATDSTTVDPSKNEQAYAELIQWLDERSMSLVVRDAKDKGREALKILRDYYRGKGKQRVIRLYTELTSLFMKPRESVTDYILRAEDAATGLREAGEDVSDGLLIAMVMKGLSPQFKSFVAVVTQSDKAWEFKDLKSSLRDYEDTERARADGNDSSVMKFQFKGGSRFKKKGGADHSQLTCHTCNQKGHISPNCPSKPKFKKKSNQNSNYSNHNSGAGGQGFQAAAASAKQASDGGEFHTFHFKIDDESESVPDIVPDVKHENELVSTVVVTKDESVPDNVSTAAVSKDSTSMIVDSGCSAHIMTDDSSFIDFDENFEPQNHSIELADGRKYSNMAEKRGTALVTLTDSNGNSYQSTLENCLYIPSYPENIFSVKAANRKGSSVCFYPNHAELIAPDGTVFNIHCRGSLFYLMNITLVSLARDLQSWHQVLGHCNTTDLLKLEPLVDGMKIGAKNKFHCEPCALGKMTQTISRKPSTRGTEPLEFVSSDVCGPISPISADGLRYVVSFIDNFSGFTFLYFCKLKSDVTKCLEKFLADISPVGKVKNLLDISGVDEIRKLRSDNGGEYMGKQFKDVLIKNKIKHEQSAPYSPHQNGAAERQWRTLFDMARCLLIESDLPQELWPYAVLASAFVRNRCYVERLSQTPYFALTGKKPDMSKMHKFGTVCYAPEQIRRKLDPKSKRGIFVGYDKESPAFLVYCPEVNRVRRCRDVKFTDLLPSELNSNNNDSEPVLRKKSDSKRNNHMRNRVPDLFVGDDDDDFPGIIYKPIEPQVDNAVLLPLENEADLINNEEAAVEIPADDVVEEIAVETVQAPEVVDIEVNLNDGEGGDLLASGGNGRPVRNRQAPGYLADYDLGSGDNVVDVCRMVNVLSTDNVVDVCRMANHHIHSVPKSYTQAVNSEDSSDWKLAMDDEYQSLKENNTFDIVPLPEGKKLVGGRWVFAIKESSGSEELFKARYVAKGFTQVHGTDYFETFSPTAKMSSIRIMMQLAANSNLTVHQMDVKTAFLNAPIDCEIYVRQPEGYEVKDKGGNLLVLKLNKSLYGLKQSGRNWNSLLHKFFVSNKFVQSALDPCVYFLRVDNNSVIILVWVDDLLLAASSEMMLSNIKNSLKSAFKMKDLGPISFFLGMRILQYPHRIEIDQTEYLTKVLHRFGMYECKPRSTPSEVNPAAFDASDSEKPNNNYRQVVGSLIYAMVCSRPDLSWVVTKLSQSLSKPRKGDWIMIKHVLQYIKGTLGKKLVYNKCSDGLDLHGYSDSDWAGDNTDRRSTTGYVFMLNPIGPPISWKSQKQSTVALSSCEAEYMALCDAAKEAKFLDMAMTDFVPDHSFRPIDIQVDNTGAIALGKNNMVTKRSKHIDIKYHFTRQCYNEGLIDITHVPTASNLADAFTKPLCKPKMDNFSGMLFGAVL